MNDLVEFALKTGATGARLITAADIFLDDDLAGLCIDPRCENYGLSANCPPHTSGPAGFRKSLEAHQSAIFFKIDVPTETLLSDQRQEIFRLLQEIAAGVEKTAVEKGFKHAKSFAGGSCKQLFCRNHRKCNVLDGRQCRNPDYARPSMSGFGVDVSSLMTLCGWKLEWPTGENRAGTGTVCGLVLV